MAQDIVVKESLSDAMIEAGAELTRMLDVRNWHPAAAFWFYLADSNRWRLMFAAPRHTSEGPLEAYATIQAALTAVDLDDDVLALPDIAVVAAEHPLVRTLRLGITTGPGINGVRFSRNAINGHFIDDAYIYRMM